MAARALRAARSSLRRAGARLANGDRFAACGSRVAASVSAAPIHDHAGRPTGVTGIARDSTARRQHEAAAARLAALVDSSTDAILAEDLRGVITDWNPAAERLYGYSAAEAVGRSVAFLVPEDRAGEYITLLARAVNGERVEHYETVRVRRDGRHVPVALTVSPIRNCGGEVIGASTITRDISERREREREVREQAALLELTTDAVFVRDAALDHITFWNSGAEALYGYSREVALGTLPHELLRTVAAEDADRGELPRTAALSLTGRWQGRLTHTGADGRQLTVLSRQTLLRDDRDRPRAVLEVNTDITARAEADRAQALLAAVTASSGDAILSFSPEGTVLSWNNAAAELFGVGADDAIGRPIDAVVGALGARERRVAMHRVLATGATARYEAHRARLDGTALTLSITLSPLRDSDGAVVALSAVMRDETDRREAETRLRHLADHDPLTGLLNRRRFREQLDHAVADARRHRRPAALLVLDLDNFKCVNDAHGHVVGDRVLLRVAEVLRQATRATDIVGRLGGDEFAVLLPDTTETEARAAAEELRGEIRAGCHIEVEGDESVRVTASIGMRRVDPGKAEEAEALLIDADVAMYDAKETGRDRVSVAGSGSAQPEKIRARLTWSQRVRDALERPDGEGFVLYEQPIVALDSGRVERGELLIRMCGRDRHDLIGPDQFLPTAERFGLIGAVDRWVIARAIRLAAARQAAGEDVGVHVNLSGGSIGDCAVMDFIAAELRNARVDSGRLTFEVTETAAIVDIDRARTLARTLAELGCRFALDDFGAGFGSFYYLKHLPFDTVKIDGDFVKTLATSRPDELIVRAMHEMASGLGKRTVAEFVQDDASLDILRSIGVDYAQGFHVGAPRPLAVPVARV